MSTLLGPRAKALGAGSVQLGEFVARLPGWIVIAATSCLECGAERNHQRPTGSGNEVAVSPELLTPPSIHQRSWIGCGLKMPGTALLAAAARTEGDPEFWVTTRRSPV